MVEVHADQNPRPDGSPYVEHPLLVATEVAEKVYVPENDEVIAALLHDSVEDQAHKLAAKLDTLFPGSDKEKALKYIEREFGHGVCNIVYKLSNPDFNQILRSEGKEVNSDNKNRLYTEHIAAAIEDPSVFLIKLMDFSQNALRLDEVADPERKRKLTLKYMPVVEIFIDKLSFEQHSMTNKAKRESLRDLRQVYEKMKLELSR